jgi:hypothetical protein
MTLRLQPHSLQLTFHYNELYVPLYTFRSQTSSWQYSINDEFLR